MLIGTMNHPANEVLSEIEWMAAMGLEFNRSHNPFYYPPLAFKSFNSF